MLGNYTKFRIISFLIILMTCSVYSDEVRLFKIESATSSGNTKIPSNFYWTVNGNQTDLFKEANGRTIVLSFLGTWCAYCQRHLPELMKLYEQLPENEYYFLNVFGEYNLERENDIIDELQTENVTFDNVWYAFTESKEKQIFELYGIEEVMMTLIINPEKKIVSRISDIISYSALDTLKKYASNINEDIKYNQAKVFPNPADNFLNIYPEFHSNSKFTLCIYNSLSEILLSQEFEDNNNICIDVSRYDTGVYYYKVFSKEESFCGKFIIN